MGYLDPGLFGILSQAGLVFLLVVASIFTFFFKPIKKLFQRIFKKEDAAKAETQANEGEAKQ